MSKALLRTLIVIVVINLVLSFSACEYNSANNENSSQASVDSFVVDDLVDISSQEDLSADKNEIIDESTVENSPPKDTVVSFLACPDNIMHPSVCYDAIERAAASKGEAPDYSDMHNADYDFYQIYEYVSDKMKTADVCYLNQETLIGGTSGEISGYPCFNSPYAIAETVIDLGVDVVNVAHNHMLDSGDTRYLENCNNVFESAGVEVIGYYPDKESTKNITVLDVKGIKIAFLAYTYGTNGITLSSKNETVIPYLDKALISSQVALAKKVSDVLIVSCHWGDENTFVPNKQQTYYAEYMCELGVDVILGMHPHVIQPMEWMISENGNKSLLVYSLGNFVSGMRAGKNMLGGMLTLNIVKDGDTGEVSIEKPIFNPTVSHYNKGFRGYKIYRLANYTDDIASRHGCNPSQLIGGEFNRENLIKTLNEIIPDEFLPEEFRKSNETDE